MIKLFDYTALCVYCSFIYYLSSQPAISTPLLFPQQDKLFHLGAYFIMGLLGWRACGHLNPPAKSRLFITSIFCCLYGLSDEWHQYFVPGRTADILDWLADSLGGLLAGIFCLSLNRINLAPHLHKTSKSENHEK